MRKEDRFRPYIYKVYNSRGNLEEYSRYYRTKKEAVEWYNSQGKWLEKNLNRKLILIDKKGNKTSSTLIAAKSYFRRAGIEHNVINNGEERLIFIETEIKNILREV